MKKLVLLFALLSGCGQSQAPVVMMQNPAPILPPVIVNQYYHIGDVVFVRHPYFICRGRIVGMVGNMINVSPVICNNGQLFYNVMVTANELTK